MKIINAKKLITYGNEQLSIILPYPQLFDFSELLQNMQQLNLSIFPTSSFLITALITDTVKSLMRGFLALN
jgi:hypothetical protein